MPERRTEPLRLEIDLDSGDPMSGTVRHSDGWHRPFVGWLELLVALERAWAGQMEPEVPDKEDLI